MLQEPKFSSKSVVHSLEMFRVQKCPAFISPSLIHEQLPFTLWNLSLQRCRFMTSEVCSRRRLHSLMHFRIDCWGTNGTGRVIEPDVPFFNRWTMFDCPSLTIRGLPRLTFQWFLLPSNLSPGWRKNTRIYILWSISLLKKIGNRTWKYSKETLGL